MSFLDKFGNKLGLNDDHKEQSNEHFDPASGEYNYDDAGHDNVVDFQSAVNAFSGQQMKMIIIEPTSFDDAQQIADHIKAHKPVVLNFENTNTDTARRIIDFISGATYALAGDIKKVGQHIFLCAPNGVNVTFSDTAPPRKPSSQSDKLPWE